MNYKIQGNEIIAFDDHDCFVMAVCGEPHKALLLMVKAWTLNGKRRARTLAKAGQLPGFAWAFTCAYCNGSGVNQRTDYDSDHCPKCRGTGRR